MSRGVVAGERVLGVQEPDQHHVDRREGKDPVGLRGVVDEGREDVADRRRRVLVEDRQRQDDDDDADDMGGAPDGDADDVEKAYYDMVEKDFTADQRREYARRGIALPDGSYPIPNREYLGRAIHALGRGTKNPKSKIKAHIAA